MKINVFIIILLGLGVIFNIYSRNYFLVLLSIVWYIASVIIMYSSAKFSFKYRFKQIRIREFIRAIKSKSKNKISPLSSLSISLAAKIGVGSLSGVALAIYYGGLGSIFWLIVISLIVSINTYVECILGIKYRDKVNGKYVGGPSYYIRKCLGNKKLSIIYSILVIIAYSGLFLSVQSNTIVASLSYFNIKSIYVMVFLFISTLIVILKGELGVARVNSKLVPGMIVAYALMGGYIVVIKHDMIFSLILQVIKEAFNIRSIIPVFLIGMQRAIFITESSLGTSAISASLCDNEGNNQAMLEVLGIHITTFIVALTTFLIIATSNYSALNLENINGIELVIMAFNYHFGAIGSLNLSLITVLFAFSTIISSYYFGESNLENITSNKKVKIIFKVVFMIVLVVSCYIRAEILWNLTDYLIAILVIINVVSILKIEKLEK